MRSVLFPTRRESGLTLIELVVAVALLAVLALMAYRGLDSMIRAGDHTQADTERWRAVSMFFNRLGEDVGHASQHPVRAGDGSALPPWTGLALSPSVEADASEDKVSAQFEFTRKSPTGSDETRLGYRLRKGRVELLLWSVLDRAPTSVAEIYGLLDGVTGMRLLYLDAGGVWRESWPVDGGQALPRAISIDLALREGLTLHRVFALP